MKHVVLFSPAYTTVSMTKSLNQSQIALLVVYGRITEKVLEKQTHASTIRNLKVGRFYWALTNAIREKKFFFQISAVRTGARAYMDATPL